MSKWGLSPVDAAYIAYITSHGCLVDDAHDDSIGYAARRLSRPTTRVAAAAAAPVDWPERANGLLGGVVGWVGAWVSKRLVCGHYLELKR